MKITYRVIRNVTSRVGRSLGGGGGLLGRRRRWCGCSLVHLTGGIRKRPLHFNWCTFDGNPVGVEILDKCGPNEKNLN